MQAPRGREPYTKQSPIAQRQLVWRLHLLYFADAHLETLVGSSARQGHNKYKSYSDFTTSSQIQTKVLVRHDDTGTIATRKH